jgi:hypothetical protein
MAKCADCGFLAVRTKETRNLEEIELESRQSGILRVERYVYIPVCFAMVANFDEEYNNLKQLPEYAEKQDAYGGVIWPTYKDLVKETLNVERDCQSFTKWHQGFTPREHQEMIDRQFEKEMENNRRKSERKWHWIELSAIIIVSGLFTLLGALIANMR